MSLTRGWRWTLALVGGLVVTGAFTALGFMTKPALLSWITLWPLHLAWQAFPAPCIEQGRGAAPICEGTPVQVAATILGVIATVTWYAVLLYWLITFRASRQKV